ncbi:aldo-keto reductase superfamily protein [Sugiyamaella lignohabitans]|uniref:Aldo-keto reductase superfamily protein n=1 Tax=Sugiyamaella lignohabitans TaxID=796027 RepID=A0A161HMH0_9ASCO|nr:aldo-keto reductase superfamily protein [Sugiyamaella lignohabitans]ANB14917.1 aldo-keto reductase superfamily protein [Sugiyamaella lignohabitans]
MSIATEGAKGKDWIVDDEELGLQLLKKAYDSGIRTIDTANVYSHGHSELIVGKFLKKYNIPRSTVVILTKVHGRVDDPNIPDTEINWINRHGLSRKHVFDSVAASVERLGTYIDVLQIHRLDKSTPKREIMETLHDIVKSGDVRYIGSSSMRAVDFAQLQFIAEKNGWTKFISMQNYYSALYREEEREMIPFCNDTGVGLIPWSPLARGVLARPLDTIKSTLRSGTDPMFTKMNHGETEADQAIINRVEEIAKKRQVSMAIVALAWVLSKGAAPIVGFNKLERIDEAVASVSFKLTDDEIAYIEEPYQPKNIIGYV